MKGTKAKKNTVHHSFKKTGCWQKDLSKGIPEDAETKETRETGKPRKLGNDYKWFTVDRLKEFQRLGTGEIDVSVTFPQTITSLLFW